MDAQRDRTVNRCLMFQHQFSLTYGNHTGGSAVAKRAARTASLTYSFPVGKLVGTRGFDLRPPHFQYRPFSSISCADSCAATHCRKAVKGRGENKEWHGCVDWRLSMDETYTDTCQRNCSAWPQMPFTLFEKTVLSLVRFDRKPEKDDCIMHPDGCYLLSWSALPIYNKAEFQAFKHAVDQ